jgi:hypothetical protein
MTTEKYKCIAHRNPKVIRFTIGKEYDATFDDFFNEFRVLDDKNRTHGFDKWSFSECFQKVEPTTTQPMRYKVTIIGADNTGRVHDNVTNEGVVNYFNSSQSKQPHKTILIEPMPEKKKVKVWFYVVMSENISAYSASNVNEDTVIKWREDNLSKGLKVSQIQSMEVEI